MSAKRTPHGTKETAAKATGRNEKRTSSRKGDTHGQEGVKGASRSDGDIGRGTPRSNRLERTTTLGGILAGGILSQLIQFKQDQIGDCDACLTWYAERKEIYSKQLEELLALQQLIESENLNNESE